MRLIVAIGAALLSLPAASRAAGTPTNGALRAQAKTFLRPCETAQRLCKADQAQFVSEYVQAMHGLRRYQWDVSFFFREGERMGVVRSVPRYCAWLWITTDNGGFTFNGTDLSSAAQDCARADRAPSFPIHVIYGKIRNEIAAVRAAARTR